MVRDAKSTVAVIIVFTFDIDGVDNGAVALSRATIASTEQGQIAAATPQCQRRA